MPDKRCEVCGAKAVALTADLEEADPLLVEGEYFECWRTLAKHAYCAEHKQPGNRKYLDGRTVTA